METQKKLDTCMVEKYQMYIIGREIVVVKDISRLHPNGIYVHLLYCDAIGESEAGVDDSHMLVRTKVCNVLIGFHDTASRSLQAFLKLRPKFIGSMNYDRRNEFDRKLTLSTLHVNQCKNCDREIKPLPDLVVKNIPTIVLKNVSSKHVQSTTRPMVYILSSRRFGYVNRIFKDGDTTYLTVEVLAKVGHGFEYKTDFKLSEVIPLSKELIGLENSTTVRKFAIRLQRKFPETVLHPLIDSTCDFQNPLFERGGIPICLYDLDKNTEITAENANRFTSIDPINIVGYVRKEDNTTLPSSINFEYIHAMIKESDIYRIIEHGSLVYLEDRIYNGHTICFDIRNYDGELNDVEVSQFDLFDNIITMYSQNLDSIQ